MTTPVASQDEDVQVAELLKRANDALETAATDLAEVIHMTKNAEDELVESVPPQDVLPLVGMTAVVDRNVQWLSGEVLTLKRLVVDQYFEAEQHAELDAADAR